MTFIRIDSHRFMFDHEYECEFCLHWSNILNFTANGNICDKCAKTYYETCAALAAKETAK